MKQLLFKIAELEIQLCAWRWGESLSSDTDSVFEQSLVNDFQPIMHNAYIYCMSKPMRTDRDRWQTLAQACTCC